MKTMIARWFERIRIGRANSYLKVCLFICMLLSVASVKASSFTVNGVSYEAISDTTCKVLAGDEAYEGMVNIPSEVSYNSVAYKVTSIGDKAFLNCDGLMDVTLPESLEEIGSEAFGNCYALTVISIPDNVCRIDKSAFMGTNLQDLYIGDCINQIGMGAFSFVPSVHLTSSIIKINDVAFEYADELSNLYIPNSVKEIEANAFAFCDKLSGVYIDDLANWCGINFGNSDANPINKAQGLWVDGEFQNQLIIPDGTTEIKKYAFYNCRSIKELKIPDSVVAIGEKAFYYCAYLTEVYLGKGILSIDNDGLNSGYIGGYAKKIYISDIASFCQINAGTSVFGYSDNDIIYDDRVLRKVELTEDDGVTKIGTRIFSKYNKLLSVSLPNTVTEIGEDAFALCDNLTKVKLSENLIQIPKGCFRYCKSVTDIELPKNIIKIGEYGFSNCISLKNIQIGDEVKYIETGCFECCEQLDSIILPATMEKLDNCFLQCGKLNKIYSYSEDPFNADFGLSLLTQSTLYVPRGSKIKYEAVYPWNGFKEIIEMDELGAVNEINGEILPDAPIIIYDSNGRLVSDSMEKLRKGIYIVKQGRLTKKIVVE